MEEEEAKGIRQAVVDAAVLRDQWPPRDHTDLPDERQWREDLIPVTMFIERHRDRFQLEFRVRQEIRQVQEQYHRQMIAQKQAGSHPPNIPDGLTLYFSPADLVDGNPLHVQWTMQVHKSEIPDSYWPNCQFTFDALFPEHYPVDPPKVTCKTPIFHPNISPSGSVDHSMLASSWRPSTTLFDVIEQLFLTFFVGDPNFNDPLPECTEAADLGLSNKEEFRRRAMALARQHKTFIPGTCPPPSRSMFL
jgi:ubiquitin-protein ligase